MWLTLGSVLQRVQEEPFDLVVTDILMPVQDGIETIKDLRKNYPAIKVIAISGGGRYIGRECLDHARRLGAHEPLWHRLGSVNGPVIVIAGERDERYVSIAARMVERIGSAARLAIVPNGGHALPLEQPEELARLIQQVL